MTPPTPTHLAGSVAFRADEILESPVACSVDHLGWNAYDPGPANGAILVERIRTFGSKVLDLETNSKRLLRGAEAFGLPSDWIEGSLRDIVQAIVLENKSLVQSHGDVSIVVLYSPTVEGRWQALAHLAPIPFQKLKHWYTTGTSLYSSEIRIPTTDFIPNSIKHRSRLHYWLADRSAHNRNNGSIAVLETTDGFIADTSVANIVLVTRQGDWITPTTRNALDGTTLQRARRLLQQHGVTVVPTEFKKTEIFQASEVLLLGTTGCIWNATRLDDVPLGTHSEAAHSKWLQSLWREWVNMDVVQQAIDRSIL